MEDLLIGWLAPNGEFHGCEFMKHEWKAQMLIEYYYGNVKYFYSEEFLYEKGFVKFTRNDAFLMYQNGHKTLTDKQAVFINEHKLTAGQKDGINIIFEYVHFPETTRGDENLKPYEEPRVIHTMDEYPEPSKFIKITTRVPVSQEFRPEIGKVYPVIKEGGKYAHLYFILVNGEEVGIYPDRECEIVDVELA